MEEEFGERVKNAGRKSVVFGIRPEDTKILVDGEEASSASITAKTELSEPMGSETLVYLNTGANSFIVKERSHVKLSNDREVSVAIDLSKIHLFEQATGQAL